MHGKEHRALTNPLGFQDPGLDAGPARTHFSPLAILKAVPACIQGVDLKQGLGMLLNQTLHLGGAGHGVPMPQIAPHG